MCDTFDLQYFGLEVILFGYCCYFEPYYYFLHQSSMWPEAVWIWYVKLLTNNHARRLLSGLMEATSAGCFEAWQSRAETDNRVIWLFQW